jgi:hypothetical protein
MVDIAEEENFFENHIVKVTSTSARLSTKDDFDSYCIMLERRQWVPGSAGKLPDNNLKTLVGIHKLPTFDIPPVAITALGLAMNDGAKKYGRFNWRPTGATVSIFCEAASRHLLAYMSGENFASDSKIHHLAHLMSSCAILLDAELNNCLNDDRDIAYKKTLNDFKAILKEL